MNKLIKKLLFQNECNLKLLQLGCWLFFKLNIAQGQIVDSLPPGFNFEVKALLYDSSASMLYAGGGFTQFGVNGGSINKISVWNGVQWLSLGSGVDDNGVIYALDKYSGNIIAGGSFNLIGGVSSKGLAKWDGINWIPFVDAVDDQNNGAVGSFFVENNNLYVGGWFDSINGIPAQGIARFDGVNWHNYPSIGGSFHAISAIIIFNNELYIGGNFNGGLGKADIIKFDGSNWISVGGGLSGSNTWINDFEIYQNKLFVAGYFQTVNGDPGNNIAIWDGISWSHPANGLFPSNVFDLIKFDNKLIAGGQINNASGVPVSWCAMWDGNNWNNFYGNILDNGIVSFATGGNDLYFGGGFQNINNIPFRTVAKLHLPTGIHEFNNDCINFKNTLTDESISFSTNCNVYITRIEIFNSTGKLVFSHEKLSSIEIQIDLSYFSNGFYFAKVIGKDFNTYLKFVKL